MNPSKPTTGITFNTTESMAEWAWRYGEAGLPHRYLTRNGGLLMFEDGSIMQSAPRISRVFVYSTFAWRTWWSMFAMRHFARRHDEVAMVSIMQFAVHQS